MTQKELLDFSFTFSMNEEGNSVYTDDKNDPGGPTKYGISLTYDRDLIPDKNKDGKTDKEDVKLLTREDAFNAFSKKYWEQIVKFGFPNAVTFMLTDMYLNPGPSITPKLLQNALNSCGHNLVVDGKIGNKTKEAVNKEDVYSLIIDLTNERIKYYQSRPTFTIYGKGWLARSARCLKAAKSLI